MELTWGSGSRSNAKRQRRTSRSQHRGAAVHPSATPPSIRTEIKQRNPTPIETLNCSRSSIERRERRKKKKETTFKFQSQRQRVVAIVQLPRHEPRPACFALSPPLLFLTGSVLPSAAADLRRPMGRTTRERERKNEV